MTALRNVDVRTKSDFGSVKTAAEAAKAAPTAATLGTLATSIGTLGTPGHSADDNRSPAGLVDPGRIAPLRRLRPMPVEARLRSSTRGATVSTEVPSDRRYWPEHLRPGALRFARSSSNYDQTIPFYRDVVGLPVVGEFADSFGEDGTIFGLPDTHIQLEIVRARGGVSAADPLDMLVFYLPGAAAVSAATAPLRTAGVPSDPKPHPYWVARGGVVHLDPDGRRVVFAPWVYGDEPEPA
jgi:catechol 2,3-dioxygenase-like lactoylglutathione lyase family enzyme